MELREGEMDPARRFALFEYSGEFDNEGIMGRSKPGEIYAHGAFVPIHDSSQKGLWEMKWVPGKSAEVDWGLSH